MSEDLVAPPAEGAGCHAGADTMREAAARAGKSEVLERYAADYPRGPHDQPQSMCPAFGSLRVGLRMRRTATILSGSACCVYGLTFTSHFYGARRTVGYVPFSSETLVTGKLFEDIREAVHAQADPEKYDTIVVTNLCVPTASGVPLQLLPNAINGVRIIGIDVPGFGVPTHAEAKDVLAGAMLKYAREEIMAGPVAAPAVMPDKPTVTLLGEMFPADPVGISMLLEPMGLTAGPVVPTREWRELYAALASPVVAAIHPFYTAAVREFEAAGRTVVGSAPVGRDGTAAWLAAIGDAFGLSADKVENLKQTIAQGRDAIAAGVALESKVSQPADNQVLIEFGDLSVAQNSAAELESAVKEQIGDDAYALYDGLGFRGAVTTLLSNGALNGSTRPGASRNYTIVRVDAGTKYTYNITQRTTPPNGGGFGGFGGGGGAGKEYLEFNLGTALYRLLPPGFEQ